jgi:hypothetical protein
VNDIKKTEMNPNMKLDLECLIANQPEFMHELNAVSKEQFEMVSFMVDSGASETVANSESFPDIEVVETTATGTEYSSASDGGLTIRNAGEKTLEVIDANADMNFMKVQMCENLNKRKFLASVSRITKAGHRVVFDTAEEGSYIESKASGKKTWLRQEGGVYFLDLWVNMKPTFGRRDFNM